MRFRRIRLKFKKVYLFQKFHKIYLHWVLKWKCVTEIDVPDWLMQGIVTVIILPIIYFPINAYLSSKFRNNDLYSEGKNAYRNFLLQNSKPIGDLFHKLDEYKNHTQMKYFFFLKVYH